MVKMIVAVGPNNLIGKNGKMPWHNKEELAFFKEQTLNSALLMGNTTYSLLPGKLPNRKMIIATKNPDFNLEEKVTSKEEILNLFSRFRNSKDNLWIAGGKSIYEQFYQEASEILISEVETDADGDTFLKINLSGWNKKLVREGSCFKVYSYTKEK